MGDVVEGAGAWRTGQLLGEKEAGGIALIGEDSPGNLSLFTFTALSSNNSYAGNKIDSYQALVDWMPLEVAQCWKVSVCIFPRACYSTVNLIVY